MATKRVGVEFDPGESLDGRQIKIFEIGPPQYKLDHKCCTKLQACPIKL